MAHRSVVKLGFRSRLAASGETARYIFSLGCAERKSLCDDSLFGKRAVSVGLSRTRVSDLSPLIALKNLHFLDLSEIKVSDLIPLADLTKLKELNLSDASWQH